MKSVKLALLLMLLFAAHAYADAVTTSLDSDGSVGRSKYDQPEEFISLSAGAYHPSSVSVSNGTYTFNYGSASLDTFLAEATFGHRLVRGFAGSLFLQVGLAYAGFSGQSSQNSDPTSSLHLNTLGLDPRLGFYMDHLPVAWLIPFADAGYQIGFYTQSGSTDFDSAQGTTGNFVGGLGLRFWLNPSSLNRDYFARSPGFPIYLSLKVNRIFPDGSALDLSATDWLAGFTVGL